VRSLCHMTKERSKHYVRRVVLASRQCFGPARATCPWRAARLRRGLVDDALVVDLEAGAAVDGQGRLVVVCARVEPDALGGVVPGVLDHPVKEIPAQALADELGHEPKILDLDLALDPAVHIAEAGRPAVDVKHVELDPLVVEDGAELVVGEALAVHPVPVAADLVVEEPVEGDLRPRDPDDFDSLRRRRNVPLGPAVHFEIVGLDGNRFHSRVTSIGRRWKNSHFWLRPENRTIDSAGAVSACSGREK